jgi:hypothetical protein
MTTCHYETQNHSEVVFATLNYKSTCNYEEPFPVGNIQVKDTTVKVLKNKAKSLSKRVLVQPPKFVYLYGACMDTFPIENIDYGTLYL